MAMTYTIREINQELRNGKTVTAELVDRGGQQPVDRIRIYKVRIETGILYGCSLSSGMWWPIEPSSVLI